MKKWSEMSIDEQNERLNSAQSKVTGLSLEEIERRRKATNEMWAAVSMETRRKYPIENVNKNERIYNSMQKTNYHRHRLRHDENLDPAKRAYSQAFVVGDDAGRYDKEAQQRISKRFKTSHERSGFWRGVRNGGKR